MWFIYGIRWDHHLVPSSVVAFTLYMSLLYKKLSNRPEERMAKEIHEGTTDLLNGNDRGNEGKVGVLDVLGFRATTRTRGQQESLTEEESVFLL